jgi:hypothetical protein
VTIDKSTPEVPATNKPRTPTTSNRIKLALLEEYVRASEKTGGDPYNSSATSSGAAWRGNLRRL